MTFLWYMVCSFSTHTLFAEFTSVLLHAICLLFGLSHVSHEVCLEGFVSYFDIGSILNAREQSLARCVSFTQRGFTGLLLQKRYTVIRMQYCESWQVDKGNSWDNGNLQYLYWEIQINTFIKTHKMTNEFVVFYCV